MEKDQTWRRLLGQIIADPEERHRIANAIRVSPVTLIRWTTNQYRPHAENFQLLLGALPDYREVLIELINQEYPHEILILPQDQDDSLAIPAAFYAQVLTTYTASPVQLRESAICALLLQQLLKHLDTHQHGTMVLFARCVKPQQGKYIRSLIHVAGQSTPPWQQQIEQLKQFLGAESLVGHALINKHPIVVQNRTEIERIFPGHAFAGEESSVAFPILLADCTVGCLYVGSTQAGFFTQRYLDLIQKYVDLFVIAFEPKDFYDLSNIMLEIMPARAQQISYMLHFNERVAQQISQANHPKQSLTPTQATTIVWQELEEELLRHSAR
jgi:hypothetical protein